MIHWLVSDWAVLCPALNSMNTWMSTRCTTYSFCYTMPDTSMLYLIRLPLLKHTVFYGSTTSYDMLTSIYFEISELCMNCRYTQLPLLIESCSLFHHRIPSATYRFVLLTGNIENLLGVCNYFLSAI